MPEQPSIKKYTPAVAKHWLFLAAGLLWSWVGIALCLAACHWLSSLDTHISVPVAAGGFGIGCIIYRFGFSRIARKNIQRISSKPDTLCLFGFQAWRSYVLIGLMVFLGYTLRHSHLPRFILAFIYMAIGTGLTFSSSLYYQQVL